MWTLDLREEAAREARKLGPLPVLTEAERTAVWSAMVAAWAVEKQVAPRVAVEMEVAAVAAGLRVARMAAVGVGVGAAAGARVGVGSERRL